MCIYNSKQPSGVAGVHQESLKVLTEKVRSPSDAKVIDTQQESPHHPIGKTLAKAMRRAQAESRVVIGVPSAVKYLSAAPEDTIFCVLAPPQLGDSAGHIQEVLLKAFCFENDIYTIQVDCAEKLGRIFDLETAETCVLIQKFGSPNELLSCEENSIIDFCEENWEAPKQPIVKLPDT